MSDIRFVDAQGDLLDEAMSEAANRRPARVPRRHRPRRLQGRSVMAAVAMALVIAGCAVAATSGLFSSGERLAVGKVDCFYTTGIPGKYSAIVGQTLETGATLVVGETPSEFCAQLIKGYDASALKSYGYSPVLDPKLISCEKDATTAAVFIASGAADQCQQLGYKPLPGSFAAASVKVRTLVSALNKLYVSRDCWAAPALIRATRTTLVQQGFRGWQVSAEKPAKNANPFGQGSCAVFVAGNDFQSIDGARRTVRLRLGLSRSLNALNDRDGRNLSAELWQHCYSKAGVRALIRRAFAASGLSPRIAITTNPDGGKGFSWGTKAETRHYANDCPVLFETWPVSGDHDVLVWLIARNGDHLPAHSIASPPLADFSKT